MAAAVELVHATCIALDGRGVLIRGPSGSGKSDLALRCLAHGPSGLIAHAATLIADDQVALERVGDLVFARAPTSIHGKIEVRGQGIVQVRAADDGVGIVLLADLVPATTAIERLPDPVPAEWVCGLRLPILHLHAFEASAAVKLLAALALHYGQRARG